MVWNPENSWEIGFAHAERYFKEHGHLSVSSDFVCEDGYALGTWMSNQRSKRNNPSRYCNLTAEQVDRLDKIGMVWNLCEKAWLEGYEHAKDYLIILGSKKWSGSYISPDGYRTGQWIRAQERQHNNGRLESNRRKMLADIGLVFGSEIKNVSVSLERPVDSDYGSVAI